MKKIFFLAVLATLFGTVSYAQRNTGQSKAQSAVELSKDQELEAKINRVKNTVELHQQLTKMFGQNYSITSPEVKEQLKKNIADVKANERLRLVSLYAIYGKEYNKYIHLISSPKE